MADQPTAFQGLLFGALALLAIVPFASLVCKSSVLRDLATEWGCVRCVACLDRVYGPQPSDDLETGQNDAHTIAAYYQALYAHRGMHHQAALALGLTTWRNDVQHHRSVRDVFNNIKLQHIQIHNDAMERGEPPSDADASLHRATMCVDDDEEQKRDDA